MGMKMDDLNYIGPARDHVKDILTMTNDYHNIDWDAVVAKCDEAIRVDPECYPAYVELGTYYSGQYNSDVTDLPRMQEYFLKAVSVINDPWNVWTWDHVIITLHDGMKDYERLIEYLEACLKKKPEFRYIRYIAHILWKKLNRMDEAIVHIDAYLKENPDDKEAMKLKNKVMKSIR